MPDDDGRGGIIASDLNADEIYDLIYSRSGLISAFTISGDILWQKKFDVQLTYKSEDFGLPGRHGPGVQATDIDDDGIAEVLFLTRDGALCIVMGNSGELIRQISLPIPDGAVRWEHLVVANFRGQGDRDILLQATNADGYRMGRFLAAYSLTDLMANAAANPLWARDDFIAAAHNGARVADLNGDGRDEVIAGSIIGPEGDKLFELPLRGHVDSVQIGDVRPDIEGLEVVAVEEGGGNPSIIPLRNEWIYKINWHLNRYWFGGNRVFLFNTRGLIWKTHYKRIEPQNIAIGDFSADRPGLEIWLRSRFNTDQQPFVFDSFGELLTTYQLTPLAPPGWSDKGIEVIFTLNWNVDQVLLAAKERHTSGAVAVIDPLSGRFLLKFAEQADRLYVADVLGDWREEIIVAAGNQVRIYANQDQNSDPDRKSLWDNPLYRKNKMTWNYYSP